MRLGNRFQDLDIYQFTTALDDYHEDYIIGGYRTNIEYAANAGMHPEARGIYLQEVVAGGHMECVHEQYHAQGHTFTIWRPHAAKKSRTIKVTFKNPRYDLTSARIQGYTCGQCGYGTSSMPWQVTSAGPEELPCPKSPDERKLRNLQKKLRDIDLLKERQSVGGEKLEATQLRKISTYDQVISEIRKLEARVSNISFIEPKNLSGICHFATLNDDVLLIVASHLPDESLLNLAKAYPRVQTLVRDTHTLLQRELKCFFLRTPLNHPTNLLGIGVNFNRENQCLESSFDWLSMDAFELFGIRKSVDKKEFDFFLPLGFSIPHFDRAYESGKLFGYLDKIEEVVIGSRKRPTAPILPETKAERALRVLYKFCNSIVVSLMRTTDDLYSDLQPAGAAKGKRGMEKTLLFASEKACIGYLQIYHLLVCIMRREPELRGRALRRLNAFCKEDQNRTKAATPDLGEFLVMAAVVAGSHNPTEDEQRPTTSTPKFNISETESSEGWIITGKKGKAIKTQGGQSSSTNIPRTTVSWKTHLASPFIGEVLTRNVRWLLEKHPSLAIIEEDNSPPEYRLHTTFAESRTSLRLVMFQVFFLETFASPDSPMATQYGFPDADVPGEITKGIKEIYAVNGWKMFFERVGFTEAVQAGPRGMSKRLRDAIINSASRGYHRFNHGREKALVAERRRVDRGVMLDRRGSGRP